jgi:hypothetical protein
LSVFTVIRQIKAILHDKVIFRFGNDSGFLYRSSRIYPFEFECDDAGSVEVLKIPYLVPLSFEDR